MNETQSLVAAAIASGLIKAAQEQPDAAPPPTESPALAVAVQPMPVQDLQLTAETADEMAQCQSAIIVWCKAKVEESKFNADELQTAYQQAVDRKWGNAALKRHAGLAMKRLDFYERMLVALEHGYQIVPSFPVTAFAIRTDKKKPLRLASSHYDARQQDPAIIEAGKGEYKNPFPVLREKVVVQGTSTQRGIDSHWAEAWRDFEFPLSMAKPRIIEAATRAMALKIFDDLGILPGDGSNERLVAKGDPIIVARIRDNSRRGPYRSDDRWVTFIVAWHLNTATL